MKGNCHASSNRTFTIHLSCHHSYWSHHFDVDDGDDKKFMIHDAFHFHKTFPNYYAFYPHSEEVNNADKILFLPIKN